MESRDSPLLRPYLSLLLIAPDRGKMEPHALGEMVRGINRDCVDRQEVLSDRIYRYDREKGKIQQVPESIEKQRGDGAMRKRNVPVLFRLNKMEAAELDRKVERSGLSREAYLRHIIRGIVPRDAPPPDYYAMMRELHKIGNNLNQIAQKAHTLNVLDVQRYDRDMKKFEETVRLITEAVILPEYAEPPQEGGQ